MYLYLNFKKYIYVKWTIACKMSCVEEIFLLKSPNFKFSTHKKWIITLYWVFFVDFLSIEGHFRLKKLINYRKNLVWKSVFDWVCSVMYMYCIYFGIVLPSCICTVYINYISTVYVYVVNNIYLSISCTVHEVQKLAKKPRDH